MPVFVSGTATISTEFSSGLIFPPISNGAPQGVGVGKKDPHNRSTVRTPLVDKVRRIPNVASCRVVITGYRNARASGVTFKRL
jgi:hypothetical protein